MSRIGRKSSFAKDLNEAIEPLNNLKQGVLVEKETLPGIVLDICSSYKPESIFIDDKFFGFENFEKGIFFIVGLYGFEEIAVVAWRRSEDELRTFYGTDENIIGRECNIVCQKQSPDAYLKADIMFNKTLSSNIKSYNKSEYMSNSFFSNIGTNYLDQTKAASEEFAIGEFWRGIKVK